MTKVNVRRLIRDLIITSIFGACFLIYFAGCKTAPKVDEFGNPLPEYKIESELNFQEDIPEPSKYIFIRLYDLHYNNPLNPANFLRFCVKSTEVSDTIASHASIGFSLNDEFYGLTSGGDHQLAIESCTDTKSNKFMKKCNPKKSKQFTYALKVTEKEYNAVKVFVEGYANSTEIKYDVWKNFDMASFATKRKFFTDEEEQKFGNVKYPYLKDNKKTKIDNWETHFVCSTFVAYTLVVNIMPIRYWFLDNKIDYRYVNVTDLIQIPGVVKLFESPFYAYNEGALAFVEENPEFGEYLDLYEEPPIAENF